MAQAQPPRHDTDVRRRKGAWQASCTCGWEVDSVSAFAAWSATRRHLTDTGAAGRSRPAPKRRPAVRLLGAPDSE